MIFQILEIGSWKWVTVIGIVGWVMVGIEVRWVVVKVQGSRWHWDEGGQHWSCTGWTWRWFIGSSGSSGVSE